MAEVKLHRMIEEGRWDEARNTIQQAKNIKLLVTSRDRHDDNALHAAIMKEAPDDVILSIIDSCEEAVFEVTNGGFVSLVGSNDQATSRRGDTPLHCAVRIGASYAVLKKLILKDPGAMDRRNSAGKRPADFLYLKKLDETSERLMRKDKDEILEELRSSKSVVAQVKPKKPETEPATEPAAKPVKNSSNPLDTIVQELQTLRTDCTDAEKSEHRNLLTHLKAMRECWDKEQTKTKALQKENKKLKEDLSHLKKRFVKMRKSMDAGGKCDNKEKTESTREAVDSLQNENKDLTWEEVGPCNEGEIEEKFEMSFNQDLSEPKPHIQQLETLTEGKSKGRTEELYQEQLLGRLKRSGQSFAQVKENLTKLQELLNEMQQFSSSSVDTELQDYASCILKDTLEHISKSENDVLRPVDVLSQTLVDAEPRASEVLYIQGKKKVESLGEDKVAYLVVLVALMVLVNIFHSLGCREYFLRGFDQ